MPFFFCLAREEEKEGGERAAVAATVGEAVAEPVREEKEEEEEVRRPSSDEAMETPFSLSPSHCGKRDRVSATGTLSDPADDDVRDVDPFGIGEDLRA
jgi:hypothetical protein